MICLVENCKDKAVSRGYCDKHRKQIKRHGRLTPESEHKEFCTIEGCNKKHVSRGYCRNHYYEFVTKVKNNNK